MFYDEVCNPFLFFERAINPVWQIMKLSQREDALGSKGQGIRKVARNKKKGREGTRSKGTRKEKDRINIHKR